MLNFFEFLVSSITRENLTFVAALIGAVGAIYSYFRQRKKVKLHILEIRNADSGFFIRCCISNQSNLPISITEVTIEESCGNQITCFPDSTPMQISIVSDKISTCHFPITLSTLEAFTGWIGFPIPEKGALLSPKHLTFRFQTTRGKIKIKALPLSGVYHSRNRTR